MTNPSADIGWVILELLGHRRLAGHVTTEEIAGASFLRIDIPGAADEPPITQFYGPSAIYAITPTSEEIARAAAARSRPRPVQRWELEPPRTYEPEEAPY
ncbi:hypothetical protein [Nonomuraea angiospora]|uniref:hypothetical protein n=1 Tax=Nonomuraea angiospora TaxID=46172 RepID=UPI0029AA482C|nr:hypothetical protein [Nonomuraea angiospora]MDX3106058.1 hypothetical protein [Nonomuraea angiospora]